MDRDVKEIADRVMKGTTTVGIVCSDGVVMGADSRATMDTFIASSEAVKTYKIDDNLGMTIAGGVGDAEYIVKLLKMQNEFYKMDEGKPMSPSAASSLLQLVLQQNKMMPYIVQLIVGGLNGTVPEMFSLDPFGGLIAETKFTSTGSGSPVAYGYLEDNYKKDITTDAAVKVVAKALKIAMKRDSATGDKTKIVIITKAGFRELSNEDIEKILSK